MLASPVCVGLTAMVLVLLHLLSAVGWAISPSLSAMTCGC
jgi:hypothetical protein